MLVDYDNDGLLDLLVLTAAGSALCGDMSATTGLM